MKRTLSIIISVLLSVSVLSACQNNGAAEADVSSSADRLSVVCTIFPQYDWARNVIGHDTDAIDLTLMSDNGVDLHSFQPSVDDIVTLSTCDMFIYVGGESDEWVTDALSQAENPDMIVINLLDVLGDSAKAEEIVEGMEEEEGEEEEEGAKDEHVWLSLSNAELFTNTIAEAFAKLDPTNASAYAANSESYIAALQTLDADFHKIVDNAAQKTLIFGDRFPFRYLTDDYGLSYFAAFPGCSAETEASFETIIFLANKFDELGLDSIIVTESSDKSIADTIIKNTAANEAEILVMNSLQSVRLSDTDSTSDADSVSDGADTASGTTYYSAMRENLEVLEAALK